MGVYQDLIDKANAVKAEKAIKGYGGDYPTLDELSRMPFSHPTVQATLPPWLQNINTGPLLTTGMERIAELIRNPGGTASTLQSAIGDRLNSERANISQNFAGLQSDQAGAAARGNMPVQIKDALARALETNQRRAQGNATRGAVAESEDLRRGDVANTYRLIENILAFLSSSRGQGMQALQGAEAIDQQNNAAQQAMIASLIQGAGATAGGGG